MKFVLPTCLLAAAPTPLPAPTSRPLPARALRRFLYGLGWRLCELCFLCLILSIPATLGAVMGASFSRLSSPMVELTQQLCGKGFTPMGFLFLAALLVYPLHAVYRRVVARVFYRGKRPLRRVLGKALLTLCLLYAALGIVLMVVVLLSRLFNPFI